METACEIPSNLLNDDWSFLLLKCLEKTLMGILVNQRVKLS